MSPCLPDLKEIVPEIVCLSADLVICGVFYYALKSTNFVLKELMAAPEIPIDENTAERLENHPCRVVSSDPKTGVVSSSLPYAVIRGDVTPLGKTVTSAYAAGPLQGVIQKVIYTEHKRNMSRTGFWVDSKRELHSFTNDAPFCLTNSQQFTHFVLEDPWRPIVDKWAGNVNPSWDSTFSLVRPHVEVTDWTDAARIDLDTVYDHFDSAGGGIGSHLWGWVVGDMQKGVQKTEEMLTKGTTLTGVGELVSGPMGIRLQPPADGRPYYLVKSSLSSLIKETQSSRTVIKVFLGIFGSMGLLVISLAAWKLYKKRVTEAETRVNQERLDDIIADRPNRQPRAEGDTVPDSIQCVVCLGAEREVILLDCGHVCSCADCAGELLRAGHACPVCRGVISRVMPAYVS